MQNSGILELTSDVDSYIQYLNTQSNMLSYSPGNVALTLKQRPGAKNPKSSKEWNSLGRSILPSERDNGIKILNRSEGKGTRKYSTINEETGELFEAGEAYSGAFYNMGYLYAETQTKGQALIKLDYINNSDFHTRLLQTASVPYGTADNIELPVYYDPEEQTIFLQDDLDPRDYMYGMIRETYLARMHDHGANKDYDRDTYMLQADSVAYMLCKHYGYSNPPIPASFDYVKEYFAEFDVQDRRAILNAQKESAELLARKYEYNLLPVHQKHPTSREDR